MNHSVVLTIARQYGSGGRDIGNRVAELLSIPHYDKELISMAAKDGDMDEKIVERVDEVASGSLLYSIAMGTGLVGVNPASKFTMPLNDRLFVHQTQVIKELAQKGSCVIIGRCADYVLKDFPGRISIFLYGDMEHRRARIAERHSISEKEAEALILKTDKKRATYYNFYTGEKWGKFENYHLSLSTSLLGMEESAQLIAQIVRKKMEQLSE